MSSSIKKVGVYLGLSDKATTTQTLQNHKHGIFNETTASMVYGVLPCLTAANSSVELEYNTVVIYGKGNLHLTYVSFK